MLVVWIVAGFSCALSHYNAFITVPGRGAENILQSWPQTKHGTCWKHLMSRTVKDSV